MLDLDNLRETHETTTATTAGAERPSPPSDERPGASRVARRPRRWAVVLATTGALAGIATVTVLAQPSREVSPREVLDDSHDRAEANRTATLRDLATQPIPHDSHDRAEANRTATLRDLATQPIPHDSHDRAEANRMAALRDLATAP